MFLKNMIYGYFSLESRLKASRSSYSRKYMNLIATYRSTNWHLTTDQSKRNRILNDQEVIFLLHHCRNVSSPQPDIIKKTAKNK